MTSDHKPKSSVFAWIFPGVFLFCLAMATTASAADTETLCGPLGPEQAAAILSVPETDIIGNSRELEVSPEDIRKKTYSRPPVSCSFRSKSDFLKNLTYVRYVFADPAQARTEFLKMKQGFETVSAVDTILDLGEEAFRAGDQRFRRLVARQGGMVIDVLNPKEFDTQVRVLRLILGTP